MLVPFRKNGNKNEKAVKTNGKYVQMLTVLYKKLRGGGEGLQYQVAQRLHRVFIEMFVSLSNIYLQSLSCIHNGMPRKFNLKLACMNGNPKLSAMYIAAT